MGTSWDWRAWIRRWWPVLPGAALGAVAGWWIGSASTLPGVQGTAGALVATLVTGALLLLVAILGAAAGRFERSRPARSAIHLATGSAVVVCLAVMAAVPALGLGDREPGTRDAEGIATISLVDAQGFVGRPDAEVTCRAPEGSEAVTLVEAPSMGRLRDGVLTAELRVPGADGTGRVELSIDVATIPGGQPIWSGRGTFDLAPGGASGTVSFDALELAEDALVSPLWPPALTGSMTWHCEGWGG